MSQAKKVAFKATNNGNRVTEEDSGLNGSKITRGTKGARKKNKNKKKGGAVKSNERNQEAQERKMQTLQKFFGEHPAGLKGDTKEDETLLSRRNKHAIQVNTEASQRKNGVDDHPYTLESDKVEHMPLQKRNRMLAFVVGLYRVYVYDNLRGVLDLVTDHDQFNAMKDFFGLFIDHFAAQQRSVRKDVFGFLMMAAYGPCEQRHGASTGNRIATPELEESIIENGLRAMSFSAAAYGYSALNHMASVLNLNFMPTTKQHMKKFSTETYNASNIQSPLAANQKELEDNFTGVTAITSLVDGVHPEDIVYTNFTSTAKTAGKLPNHFIVIDQHVKAVVVSFRGTFSLSEAITDVNCLPERFSVLGEKGYAHIAMLKGAKMAKLLLEDVIVAAMECHPGYRLWICGHSLGAGVAVLFAIMLKEAHPDLPIECWGFGCPSILTLNLARKVSTCFASEKDKEFDPPIQFMQVFATGEDNIPRLSHGSLLDLASMADQLWVFFHSKRDGVLSAILYFFKSTNIKQNWPKLIGEILLMVVIMVFVAIFGYAAKIFTFCKSIYKYSKFGKRSRSFRRSLTKSFSRAVVRKFSRSSSIPAPDTESCSDSDSDGASELRRIPTLYQKLSNPFSDHSDHPRYYDHALSQDRNIMEGFTEDELQGLCGHSLSHSSKYETVAEVVKAAKSRDERDALVQTAAQRFLKGAKHDKLYPPDSVYHIQFGSPSEIFMTVDPLQYYSIEKSAPEYFGWLLLSARMVLHHTPRAYMQSLKTLLRRIKVNRARARGHWTVIRRKSRMARLLSNIHFLPGYTKAIEVIDKLEKASDSFTNWVSNIEYAGQNAGDLKAPCASEMKKIRKVVQEQFSAKKAWKKLRVRSKAFAAAQQFSEVEIRLNKAIQDIALKEKQAMKLLEEDMEYF